MAGDIYAALAAIAGEVGSIAKGRRNTSQGYNFRGIDDIYEAFHPLLVKHRVVLIPEVLDIQREERPSKSGGLLISSVVKVKYTFYATDGSSASSIVCGEGMDSGDKSLNKALSGAQKYLFVQSFTTPTGENVDSEHEDPEPAPKAKTEVDKAYDENYERLAGLLKAKTLTKDACTEWREKMDAAKKGPDAVSALTAIRMDIEKAAETAKIGEVV